MSYSKIVFFFKDTCTLHPHRKVWSVMKCSLLKSALFEKCHAEVPVEYYVEKYVSWNFLSWVLSRHNPLWPSLSRWNFLFWIFDKQENDRAASNIEGKLFFFSLGNRCVLDSCGCDMGGDCECLCTSFAEYAHECNSRGIPIKWRSQELCRRILLLQIFLFYLIHWNFERK